MAGRARWRRICSAACSPPCIATWRQLRQRPAVRRRSIVGHVADGEDVRVARACDRSRVDDDPAAAALGDTRACRPAGSTCTPAAQIERCAHHILLTVGGA